MEKIAEIRNKLYDYIRVADDKKLHAIYLLLESEIESTSKWWENKKLISELDRRNTDLENGTDPGVTKEQIHASIEKLRKKRYGK